MLTYVQIPTKRCVGSRDCTGTTPLPTASRDHGIGHALTGHWPCLVACLFIIAAFGYARPVGAQVETEPAQRELSDLSLEELKSLSIPEQKRTRRLTDVPAAVYVLTQDDIRRAGAVTLPEALRLVPGLEVAQIDASRWAISVRGFNNRLSNKLLVMQDGRTLYTPAFGGVFWDAQDTFIDDIERIEVVRGPGAANWGPNAVNGVVNIITKSATQTDGALVHAEAGLERPGSLSARYGDADNPDFAWRVFGKLSKRDSNAGLQGNELHDEWQQARGGARADMRLNDADRLRLSLDGYVGRSGIDTLPVNFLQVGSMPGREHIDGIAAGAAWSHSLASGGAIEVEGNFDHNERQSPSLGERRNTIDLSLRHRWASLGRQSVVWGATARHSDDAIPDSEVINIEHTHADLDVYSLFAQDEVAFLDRRLVFAGGAKLEGATGSETLLLPNLRARYTLTEGSTLWAAISTGARRPSRYDQEVSQQIDVRALGVQPPSQLANLRLSIDTRPKLDAVSERLTAYEVGVRQELTPVLSVDLTGFYNDYRHLTSLNIGAPECLPSRQTTDVDPLCVFTANEVIIPAWGQSNGRGQTWGGELQLNWVPFRHWRLLASYAHLTKHLSQTLVMAKESSVLESQLGVLQLTSEPTFVTGGDPKQQFSLQSFVSLNPRWDWNAYLRRVSTAVPAGPFQNSQVLTGVPSYTELNMRLAWRPTLSLEVALLGTNLLHNHHREYISEYVDLVVTEIERSVALQLRWAL